MEMRPLADLKLTFVPEGLRHRAAAPTHKGFKLGVYVPPGTAGIAYHGTDFSALEGILRDGGRLRIGPAGNLVGVYHSEQRRTAEGYMFPGGPSLEGIGCVGVLLRLRVTGLLMYNARVRDEVTKKFVVPGPNQARWKNRRTVQSCSPPANVELDTVYMYFGLLSESSK